MDDFISRSALLAAYDKAHHGPPGGARKLIEEAPEAIVRCENCGHQGNRCIGIYRMFIECKKTGSVHHETWFCADGERSGKDERQ